MITLVELMRVTKLLFGALGFVVLGKKYVGRGWRCLWQHVVAAIAYCVLHTYTRGWGWDNRYTRSDNGFLIAFWSSVILYDDRSYMRLTNLPTPFKNWALRHLHKRTDLADPSPSPTHTAVLAIFPWPWFWSFLKKLQAMVWLVWPLPTPPYKKFWNNRAFLDVALDLWMLHIIVRKRISQSPQRLTLKYVPN